VASTAKDSTTRGAPGRRAPPLPTATRSPAQTPDGWRARCAPTPDVVWRVDAAAVTATAAAAGHADGARGRGGRPHGRMVVGARAASAPTAVGRGGAGQTPPAGGASAPMLAQWRPWRARTPSPHGRRRLLVRCRWGWVPAAAVVAGVLVPFGVAGAGGGRGRSAATGVATATASDFSFALGSGGGGGNAAARRCGERIKGIATCFAPPWSTRPSLVV